MANLRTNNLSGEQGQNAIRGSVNFGGYLDGIRSDYLSVADHDDFDMGQGEFTFECWLLAVKHAGTSDPNYMGIASSQNYTTDGFLIQVANDGQLRLVGPLSGGAYFEQSAGPSLFKGWNHVAVVRTSGTIKGFVNGIEVISASQGTNIDFSLGGSFNIGENGYSQYPGDYPLRGTISNLRLTKGLARYTSTFTPPAYELTADADTVLLCCQDSDDPTQEATGKSITAIGNFRSDKNDGNLITNALDWDGAASSYSTTMPHGWTAGNGAQVQYESGGNTASGGFGDYGAGAESRMLRLRNDGNNSFINQEIPTVIGQAYRFKFWFEAQNSGLGMRMNAGTSAGATTNLGDQFNVGSDGDESERTKFFIATATTTHISIQIISGTDGASVYIDNVVVDAVNPLPPKIVPPYGVDAGNTFGGSIQQSTEGYMYFPTGRTEERGRGRGLIGGGSSPTNNNSIEFINIQSEGNSIDFGDLAVAGQNAGASSSTRALFGMGGQASPGGKQNVIQFVEIATQGNAVDFGDRTIAKNGPGGLANQTRAVFAGGGAPVPQSDVMDFVTIASIGNATDFGNMTSGNKNPACTASSTRGILVHGGDPLTNVIDFITIATAGNAQDFGDATVSAEGLIASSSPTRGIIGGGLVSPAQINNIMFITIATTGNATDFGDLTQARQEAAGISNSIRACFASGGVPSAYNNIDFVTIATTGNAIDFGDTLTTFGYRGGASDSHGGLS